MSTTPNTPARSAHLPAQVTPAPEHVTGSCARALAGATAASPTGQDQPMSDGLGPACAELAALLPALIPALSRDSVPSGGRTALSAGKAVNPDVLHAMVILAAEIPAACAAACQVTGEPWQPHPSAICLHAIPRLHHQLAALGMPAAASDLETGVHHWTRMVKLALGLRTPDIPVGWDQAADGRWPTAGITTSCPPTPPANLRSTPFPLRTPSRSAAPAGRTRPRHRRRGLRA